MTVTPEIMPLTATATGYLQLPGGWFLNNAGWVTGRDTTLLVDTCATETRSRHLLDAARASSPAGVSAVLTHAHGDHANGAAQVARGGGAIMASPSAAREITSGPHIFPATFTCSTWGDIAPPSITDTVREPTTVDLGGSHVEIVPVPGVAHTTGDLVVWLPGDGVLFTGDLVFHGVTPLAFSGSVVGWLDALRWLEHFEARLLVPGHGPVMTGDSTVLLALRDYLRWLMDAVCRGGEPDFDALEAEGRARWPTWREPERHAVNLRIAHAEACRHVLDTEAALQAMLRAAGGPISLDI